MDPGAAIFPAHDGMNPAAIARLVVGVPAALDRYESEIAEPHVE